MREGRAAAAVFSRGMDRAMTRTHMGLMMMGGGVVLFALALLAGNRSDRGPAGGRVLAVASIGIGILGVLVTVAGVGVAVSSAVFP